MTTTVDTVNDVLTQVLSPEYMTEGFFLNIALRTPSEDRYRTTLETMGYEGEINTVPDRNGSVATMFITDDKRMALSVFYQGDKPEKPSVDDDGDGEPSEGESDLDSE
jgi:hypothetical protein